MSGPYETRAQARADAAELIAAECAADPGHGPMTDAVRAARRQVRVDYLVAALTAAGVELGEFDRRIAAWLADWETETLQVLVGWITRSHAVAELEGLPWRVYAQPESGARWLVNAFATRQLAERFAERHPAEYGPLSVESTEAPEQQITHHAIMRHGIGGPECGTASGSPGKTSESGSCCSWWPR